MDALDTMTEAFAEVERIAELYADAKVRFDRLGTKQLPDVVGLAVIQLRDYEVLRAKQLYYQAKLEAAHALVLGLANAIQPEA